MSDNKKGWASGSVCARVSEELFAQAVIQFATVVACFQVQRKTIVHMKVMQSIHERFSHVLSFTFVSMPSMPSCSQWRFGRRKQNCWPSWDKKPLYCGVEMNTYCHPVWDTRSWKGVSDDSSEAVLGDDTLASLSVFCELHPRVFTLLWKLHYCYKLSSHELCMVFNIVAASSFLRLSLFPHKWVTNCRYQPWIILWGYEGFRIYSAQHKWKQRLTALTEW